MKHYKIIVVGQVQGVGYRYATKKKATELEIKGVVRNVAEGHVEIVCYGGNDNLKEFIEFCKNNPGWSKIDHLEIEEIEDTDLQKNIEQYSTFEIIG